MLAVVKCPKRRERVTVTHQGTCDSGVTRRGRRLGPTGAARGCSCHPCRAQRAAVLSRGFEFGPAVAAGP